MAALPPPAPVVPEPSKLTKDQERLLVEVLGIESGDIYVSADRCGVGVELWEWPAPEKLTAKTLLGLAQELGYSDVQVKPDGYEREDLVLIFIK